MADPILSIRDLCVDYVTDRGPVRAIDRVSLDLMRGETLGLAGESGCGKSTLAQSILRILPPPAVISQGRVLFDGQDVLQMDEDRLRAMRWDQISMVFQSAMDALNPVISVGEQLSDTLMHRGMNRARAMSRAAELLDKVGIPTDRLRAYPHQLSGGMRQRVGIALALALEPSLVILDEPTTALDVVVEQEILGEIKKLQAELGFAVLFITHDLARMLQVCDRVAIFYAARMVELAPAQQLRERPRHPYTQGLLRAFPSVRNRGGEPESIPGSPPSLADPPPGCRFHPRCNIAVEKCSDLTPGLTQVGDQHLAACSQIQN